MDNPYEGSSHDPWAHSEIDRLSHRILELESTVKEMQGKFDSIQEWSDLVTEAVNGMAVHVNYKGAANADNGTT